MHGGESAGGSGRRRARLRAVATALALAVLVAAVFGRAVGNAFLDFDDDVLVTENPHVRGGLTGEAARWALGSVGYGGNWHPLTWFSHLLDVQLFGLDPRGHHLVSVLLHAAAAAAAFLLLRAMTGARWRSLLAAALFALHPLRVESVAWVAERKDVLSVLLGLLALAAWVRHARRPSPSRYALVLLPLALSLASKPALVTFPLLALLLDLWPLGRLRPVPGERGAVGQRLGRLLLEKLPLLALCAGAAWIAFRAQAVGGGMLALERHPLGLRLGNAAVSCMRYLRQTVLPLDLAVFYPHPGAGLSAGEVAAAAGLLLAAAAVAIALRRRLPFAAFGTGWFLAALLPTLGLVQVGAQGMADRYTYLPHLGLFVALAWGLAALPPVDARGAAAKGIAAAGAVAVLSLLTWRQIGWWRDNLTLFRRALEVTEGNWLAHGHVARGLRQLGLLEEAAGHYREALRIRPAYATAAYNLGGILMAQGRTGEAVEQYRAALAANPYLVEGYNNLGAALILLGRPGEALDWLEKALRFRPDVAEVRFNLGAALEAAGRPAEAEAQFREALRLDPRDARTRERLERLAEARGGGTAP